MPTTIFKDLIANAERKLAEFEALKAPGQAEGQLGALTAALQSQIQQSPFESAGYQSEVGSLRDLLAESAESDAGRGAALGITPGMSVAAGAGARSKALASGVRSAAGRAEGVQQRQTGQLAGLLGTQAGLEQNRQGLLLSLIERQRDRKAAEKGSFLDGLFGLASTGIGLAFGRPPTPS